VQRQPQQQNLQIEGSRQAASQAAAGLGPEVGPGPSSIAPQPACNKSQLATAAAASCAVCGKTAEADGVRLRLCAGCRAARFCSDACYKAGWRCGHKQQCLAAQAAKKAADSSASCGNSDASGGGSSDGAQAVQS
jgi:hypothetical protein